MILQGKVAVVTGAGSGMGKATALLLAREGAAIIVADANLERSGQVVAEIKAIGGRALSAHVDVSDEAQVQRMVALATNHFSEIDILVNCAAISEFIAVESITTEKWSRMINVGLSGTFYCCREVGKEMIRRGQGRIINFASTAGVAGIPYMAHYSAAKHGVVGLTKAIATEWGKHNITVNCICPGATLTPMLIESTTEEYRKDRAKRVPLRRLATPGDQASVVLFLASPAADYVTGNLIYTDGGISALAASTSSDAMSGDTLDEHLN